MTESTVAVVSHVLLNALSVIVGSAATLRAYPEMDPKKVERMLTTIEEQGYLAARLVESLARGNLDELDLLLNIDTGAVVTTDPSTERSG